MAGIGLALQGAGAGLTSAMPALSSAAKEIRQQPIEALQMKSAQQNAIMDTAKFDEWQADQVTTPSDDLKKEMGGMGEKMMEVAKSRGVYDDRKDVPRYMKKAIVKDTHDNPEFYITPILNKQSELKSKLDSFTPEIEAVKKELYDLKPGVDDAKIEKTNEKIKSLQEQQSPFAQQYTELSRQADNFRIMIADKERARMAKPDLLISDYLRDKEHKLGTGAEVEEFKLKQKPPHSETLAALEVENQKLIEKKMNDPNSLTKEEKNKILAFKERKSTIAAATGEARKEAMLAQPTGVWDRVTKTKHNVSKQQSLDDPERYLGVTTPEAVEATPTSDIKVMQQSAPSVLSLADKTLSKIDDKNLGPLKSRWRSAWQGGVGASDPKFAALRADVSLLETRLMKMHVGSRGSEYMMKHFTELLGVGKQSPDNMRAALKEITDYANEVKNHHVGFEPGGAGSEAVATAPTGDVNGKYGKY